MSSWLQFQELIYFCLPPPQLGGKHIFKIFRWSPLGLRSLTLISPRDQGIVVKHGSPLTWCCTWLNLSLLVWAFYWWVINIAVRLVVYMRLVPEWCVELLVWWIFCWPVVFGFVLVLFLWLLWLGFWTCRVLGFLSCLRWLLLFFLIVYRFLVLNCGIRT